MKFHHIVLTISFICSLDLNLLTGAGADDQITEFTEKKERVLSRRRRYLIFPVGSSFQLVYDGVITVPDYTIYIVTGVTCALAWGLPTKPTYPDQELMEQYENGTLPLLLYRKDENVTESNSHETKDSYSSNSLPPPVQRLPTRKFDHRTMMNLFRKFYEASRHRDGTMTNNLTSHWNGYGSTYPIHHKDQPINSYYFGNKPNNSNWSSNYFHPPLKSIFSSSLLQNNLNTNNRGGNNKVIYYSDIYNSQKAIRPPLVSHIVPPTKKTSYDSFTDYIAENYFKPWIEGYVSEKSMAYQTTEPRPIIRNKLHTVYPAMGKRSLPNYAQTFEDKFYLDHHRDTRHNLYKLIERYLFAKGFNGTACVLKTLCEVGQKRREDEPGSFLAEIIRVIFSLTQPQLKHPIEKRHIDYDDAHWTYDNCTERYHTCKDSVWNAGFLLESYDNLAK